MQINITREQFEILCITSPEFRKDLWDELHRGSLEDAVKEVCDGVMGHKIACCRRVRGTFTLDYLSGKGISRQDVEDAVGGNVAFDNRGMNLLHAKELVERFLTFS